MRLSIAALAIAAEDDATVTNSPCPLPLLPYLQRIERLATDTKVFLEQDRLDCRRRAEEAQKKKEKKKKQEKKKQEEEEGDDSDSDQDYSHPRTGGLGLVE